MGDKGLNLAQLLFFVAIVALIVGLVFHIIYLVKDRSVETPQDEYNSDNAKMFYLLAVGLAIVAMLLAAKEKRDM
jgi:amino acid permease